MPGAYWPANQPFLVSSSTVTDPDCKKNVEDAWERSLLASMITCSLVHAHMPVYMNMHTHRYIIL